MAVRRKKKKNTPQTGGEGWLVTFVDLMTLLLTFFVLLISMASLTQSSFTEINSFFQPRNFIEIAGPGNIPQRIELIMKALRDLEGLDVNKERIKDLLFPLDMLPDEMDRSTLEKNLDIIKTGQGLAIVMTDKLLFPPGEYELSAENKKFLAPLYDVLLYTDADVNIAGHTSNEQLPGVDNYELSGMRALAVLEYFLLKDKSRPLKPRRMSVSAYGPDRPLTSNDSTAGMDKNARVEILLKGDQALGAYK